MVENPTNLKKSYFEDSDDSIRDPNYENSRKRKWRWRDRDKADKYTNSDDNKYQKEKTTPKGKKKMKKGSKLEN